VNIGPDAARKAAKLKNLTETRRNCLGPREMRA
jgi:hypothetical protein